MNVRRIPGMGSSLPGSRRGRFAPVTKAKNSRATLKRLWEYLSRQNLHLGLAFLAVVVSSLLTLAGPYLIGLAIDTMVKGQGMVNFHRLVFIVLGLLMVYLLVGLTSWLQMYYIASASQETLRDLRKDLFAKMQTLSLGFFDSHPHGELMSRLSNDVETINNTLSQSTTQLVASLITVVGSVTMMFLLNPVLALPCSHWPPSPWACSVRRKLPSAPDTTSPVSKKNWAN